MKCFAWSVEKNEQLKQERGICFEEIGQRIFVIQINDYAYLAPFVEGESGKPASESKEASELEAGW